ncbi:unnamed protein product [Closterium sp. Naga37s-1]|nr:unnamed protein product [Closterium sp. Naga37s-1]
MTPVVVSWRWGCVDRVNCVLVQLPPFAALKGSEPGFDPRPVRSLWRGTGPSVPAAAPSSPAAAPAPLALFVEPPVSALAGVVADPPVLAPDAPVAPPASVPDVPAPVSVSSPKAASATTGGPAPLVAPSAAGQSALAAVPMAPAAPAGQPSRPPSPDRRLSRPHSPALHQERASSRRRRDSPRRYQQQSHWPAQSGGRGGWRGPRGRSGGGEYRPPVTMADLQREVSKAVREERAAQSQSSSMHASPARAPPRPAAIPSNPLPAAAPHPQVPAPTLPAPAALAPAPEARLRLLPVPPVVGVEYVAAGGGAAGARYSPHVAGGSAFLAADEPFHFLAEALQPPQTRVPEATLGQLSRLAESLHALLLIQVLAHASLPAIPAETFHDRPRETCLDATDQLAVLMAPALAAPAEGGAAAVGQLDEAVRGLRRHLRSGSGAAAIGASTLVVRELWRTLTGILHALGAHRM